MNNFVYYVPTKICFGRGEISHLAERKESGKRELLSLRQGGADICRKLFADFAADQSQERY